MNRILRATMSKVCGLFFWGAMCLLLPTSALAVTNNASGYAPLFQDDDVITGVVRDAGGETLPGVSVYLKDTNRGTVTDIDGRFSIDVDDVEDPVLVFSFVGFQDQEIAVDDVSNLEVTLEVQTQVLDEVVVVGYGTQRKANLTGAVSQVEAETLEDRPITNVTSAMQGLMPGVTITGASGVPGNNGGSIRIRGISTWDDASPLIVIDGIPGGKSGYPQSK